jgi:dihydroneopterin aldolase
MIIKIKNLKLITNLGVYDWEKNFDRDILVNATIETKEINSTKSDILSETID